MIKRSLVLLLIIVLISPNSISAQIPDSEYFDDHIYFGYEYGAAGISSVLVNMINSDLLPDVREDTLKLIVNAMNTVWEKRIVYENESIASWGKYSDTNEIYPGMKYGASGIIQTFIDIYNLTEDKIWLNRAEEAYWQLASEAYNSTTLPSWSYSYREPAEFGIPITDIKYGSAGILNTAILLYDTTKNQSYLDHGNLIVDWLKSISVEYSFQGNTWDVLPWYDLDTSNLPIKTGYNWGNAGIAPILYRFSDLINDQSLKTWSLEIMDFLKSVQSNKGSWEVDMGIDSFNTDIDSGVAGILKSFLEMQTLSGVDYSSSINSSIDFLFSQMILNDTTMGFYSNSKLNSILNSYNSGLLGILSVLKQADKYLRNDQKITVDQAFEWLLTSQTYIFNNGLDKLLFFKDNINQKSKIIDLSLADGISGMLLSLIELESNPHNVSLDIKDFIQSIYNTIVHFKTTDNLWSKMKILPDTFPVQQLSPISHSYILTTEESNFSAFNMSIFIIMVVSLFKKAFVLKTKN